MGIDRVSEAYSARADDYRDAVGRIEHAAQQDRDDLLTWARGVKGPILDVGCGPGQWTSFLHERGIDIAGIDPVEAFIDDARRRYPGVRYRTGRAEGLGVPNGSLGGILAWFSLIHTHPRAIDVPLAELARCLRQGGSLALGFFAGPDREPFDHAITTAYTWSVDGLGRRVEQAGFTVVETRERTDPGARPQGLLVAERSGAASPRHGRALVEEAPHAVAVPFPQRGTAADRAAEPETVREKNRVGTDEPRGPLSENGRRQGSGVTDELGHDLLARPQAPRLPDQGQQRHLRPPRRRGQTVLTASPAPARGG